MNLLDRDIPMATQCAFCGAPPWPGDGHDRSICRCAPDCPKPHGDGAGAYIIHCSVGDGYDTKEGVAG